MQITTNRTQHPFMKVRHIQWLRNRFDYLGLSFCAIQIHYDQHMFIPRRPTSIWTCVQIYCIRNEQLINLVLYVGLSSTPLA